MLVEDMEIQSCLTLVCCGWQWVSRDHLDCSPHGPTLQQGEIAPFVTLDAKNLEYFYNRKDRGAPWGASQPCNAFLDLSAFTRTLLFFTSEPRDTLWKQRTDVAVHSSVEARANPVNRNYKIIQPTPNELKVRNPVYLKLNDLEEELKKKWKFDKVSAHKLIYILALLTWSVFCRRTCQRLQILYWRIPWPYRQTRLRRWWELEFRL